jgi:hypothetical protein
MDDLPSDPGLDCVMDKCGPEMMSCMSDPTCEAELMAAFESEGEPKGGAMFKSLVGFVAKSGCMDDDDGGSGSGSGSCMPRIRRLSSGYGPPMGSGSGMMGGSGMMDGSGMGSGYGPPMGSGYGPGSFSDPLESCWSYDPCEKPCPADCLAIEGGTHCPSKEELDMFCSGAPPPCDVVIMMLDLDCNMEIERDEWSALGNCHDPAEFAKWDSKTSGDGVLDMADCAMLGADVMGELGDIAMYPACDGPSTAEI